MTLGERIKAARKVVGITQKELAEKAGTATITVQQWELNKRKPKLETAYKIAEILDVDIHWLLQDQPRLEVKTRFPLTEHPAGLLIEPLKYLEVIKAVKEENVSADEIKIAIEFIKRIKKGE